MVADNRNSRTTDETTAKHDKPPAAKDAEGQFAGSQADRHASGVHSAKPTVITGSEDATVNRTPPGKDPLGKDWDVNFDETAPDKS